MRCDSCGMSIVKKPIREEVDGAVHYYCCLGCFEQNLCRRDRALRRVAEPGRASRTRRRRTAVTPRP